MKAALAGRLWLAAGWPAWLRFHCALHNPARTQNEKLRRLLASNAACAFGRAHGFGEIRSYEQFRERVPLSDGTALEPWVARVMRGEKSVLTSEPPLRLLPTSGTTGGRKLIPFTRTFQRELNAAIGPWMLDLARRHRGSLAGPMYWSVSPAIPSAGTDSAVPVGFDDDSAYVGTLRRWCVEAAFAVPSALRLAPDVETSRYLTLLCLLRARGLRLVSVWHPSFFALLLDALPARWDELLRDIERGGCARAENLPPALQRAVHSPPQPSRATELRAAGHSELRATWPELRVVSCWADAQAALPAAALQRRLPHVALQPKGLLATEAVVSIPFAGAHPLAITSHFYEFADGAGRIHRAHELRHGETYGVIITTGSGLWRHQLGDLVEVDGFIGHTPSLRFLGRTGCVSDLYGEKLAEPFVTRAIEAACAACDATPDFAMLAPETDGTPRYTLFVEGDIPDTLATRLDAELRANPHYALCRDLGQLGPLRLSRVRGAHGTFCKVMAGDGRKLGDIKPQSLSPRTDWRSRFERRDQ